MSSKRQPPLLESELGDRYSISLTEFQNNIYAHIKDRFGKGDGKRVSLHLDGLLELNRVLPEFVQKAEKRKRTLQVQDGEDLPEKRMRTDGSNRQ